MRHKRSGKNVMIWRGSRWELLKRCQTVPKAKAYLKALKPKVTW